jgi:hypothetical protein
MAKAEEAKKWGPFLYLWFALSMLVNISGIGSIVDGLVHWVGFFREAVDIYRAWIREPLSWTVHLVWPSGWPRIPGWAFDLFVVWSTFFLAANIAFYRNTGKTLVAATIKNAGVIGGYLLAAALFLGGPIIVCINFFRTDRIVMQRESIDGAIRRESMEIVIYFFLIIAIVAVFAFLNWQLQHR